MNISESNDVEKTLKKPDLHQQWAPLYRTAENEKFYLTVRPNLEVNPRLR